MINSTKKRRGYSLYIATCKQQFDLSLVVLLCAVSLLISVVAVFSTDGSPSDIGGVRWVLGGTCVVLLGLAGVIWRYQQRAKKLASTNDADSQKWMRLQLDIVEYFSQSIFRSNSPEDILWDIASQCIQQLGFEDCVIYLLDEDRQIWLQKAAYGPKNIDYRAIHKPIELPFDHGVVGAVGSSGQGEIVADTRLDSRYIVDDESRCSEMAMPIICDNRVIGIIDSEHSQPGFYQAHHARIVKNIAAICGQKIGRFLSEKRTEEFAKFFAQNPNPVFRLNRDGRVIMANDSALRQLADIITVHEKIKIPHLREVIKDTLESGQGIVIQEAHNGRILQWNVAPVSELEYVNVYGFDVTDLEFARARAEKAERVKADFLSVMSHEIRTPLNAIIGLNELLLHDDLDDKDQKEYLSAMQFSGNHLLALVNDILNLEKLDSGKVRKNDVSFDVLQLFHDIFNSFTQHAKAVNTLLVLELADNLPVWVRGDIDLVTQMLNNLIGNAIKFTLDGKIILRVATTGVDGFLRIEVEDSGVGIAPEHLERILDPFEQENQGPKNIANQGTGLGLAITQRLAALYRGQLVVSSRLGEGSCFVLELQLPSCEPVTNDDTQADRDVSVLTSEEPVLLVDDNRVNLLVARRMLERWGYKVITAEDGQKGLDAWRQYHPFLILMDLQMPVMDGFEAVRRIRDQTLQQGIARIPIIALTADAESSTQQRALDAGMDDIIVKPLNPKYLREVVAHWKQSNIV